MVHNGGMSFSPSAERAVSATSNGWFAIAIGIALAATVASTVTWALVGQGWAAGVVFVAIAAVGAGTARQRGRESLVAYVTGTLATIAGLYAVVLLMAAVYMVVARY